eukprot:1649910-Karenia_brevis.AAC.1
MGSAFAHPVQRARKLGTCNDGRQKLAWWPAAGGDQLPCSQAGVCNMDVKREEHQHNSAGRAC